MENKIVNVLNILGYTTTISENSVLVSMKLTFDTDGVELDKITEIYRGRKFQFHTHGLDLHKPVLKDMNIVCRVTRSNLNRHGVQSMLAHYQSSIDNILRELEKHNGIHIGDTSYINPFSQIQTLQNLIVALQSLFEDIL